MTRGGDTPASVHNSDSDERFTQNLEALLMELRDMLATLVNSGLHNYIDLAEQDLSTAELKQLKQVLGNGTVKATVDELGLIQIAETGIPGIWWITHISEDNQILSEVIEVTTLPELLVTQHQDLHESVAELQTRLRKLQARQ